MLNITYQFLLMLKVDLSAEFTKTFKYMYRVLPFLSLLPIFLLTALLISLVDGIDISILSPTSKLEAPPSEIENLKLYNNNIFRYKKQKPLIYKVHASERSTHNFKYSDLLIVKLCW